MKSLATSATVLRGFLLSWGVLYMCSVNVVHADGLIVDTIPPLDIVSMLDSDRSPTRNGDLPVVLALSGGGARGLAQIGVLRAFEESGIRVDAICGVSMGSIIGGLYASGIRSDSLESLARSIDWGNLIRNSPPRARLLLSQKEREANWFFALPLKGLTPQWPTGATSAQGIYNLLSSLTQAATYRSEGDFDRLPIRFRAVATDLVTGQRIVFSHGELAYAMRAAMAFPLAVTPLRDGNHLYADGGLVDPLPVELARTISDAPVVAVNTATGLSSLDAIGDPYTVANQATAIMTAPLLNKALREADYVCEPSVRNVANFEFGAIDSLIRSGYVAGLEVARRLRASENKSDPVTGSSGSNRLNSFALGAGITAADCPPSIANWASSGASVEYELLRDSAEAAVRSGLWESVALTRQTSAQSGETKLTLIAQPTPILKIVRFEGATAQQDETLKAAMNLAVGRRPSPDAIVNGLRRVLTLYHERGYALVSIERAQLSDDGVLTIGIDEAPLAGVKVEGNESVRDWVILRNFPLKRGIPFNARLVSEGLVDLQATNLFEQITTSITRTPNGPILTLRVREKSTDALRVGLHHNLEYQSEGFIQWASVNLFGLGNELVAHAQYSPRREHYFAQFQSDRIFRTYLAARLGVYYLRHQQRLYHGHERIGTFQTKRIGFVATFAQNISRFAQLAVRIGSEQTRLERDSTSTTVQLSRVSTRARFDDLDDLDFPTRGRRMSAEVIWADDFLDGDVVYRAFSGDLLWVVSPHDKLTLLGGARFATADRVLPIYERFSIGGRRSLMGLSDDEILGDHVLTASLTGRYQVYSLIYMMVRADAGNAWTHGVDVDFWGTLRAGIGGGVQVDTPIGPLSIIQGFADRGDARFYFSWGYEF